MCKHNIITAMHLALIQSMQRANTPLPSEQLYSTVLHSQTCVHVYRYMAVIYSHDPQSKQSRPAPAMYPHTTEV